MARVARPGVSQIYEMHRRWMVEVLGPGDSLLTSGAAIWTVEHLDELEQRFIGQPDLTKNKRFLVKLHDQLNQASPQAIQLMAELHVVHFLIIWNGAISGAKKRSDLDAILSWMPTPCAVPTDVSDAMEPGLVHPGQWVMTRRDTQLTWLIRFSRKWKDLPPDDQQHMVDDPWSLRDFVDTIQAPTGDSARLALLHLAHPDTFEAIVSTDHRQRIVDRFVSPTSSIQDLDRLLLQARAALTPDYGEGFDWYQDPLMYLWLKNGKAWPAFVGWVQRFRALPDFDEEERTFKLDLAKRLRAARTLVVDGSDEWLEGLARRIPRHVEQPHAMAEYRPVPDLAE